VRSISTARTICRSFAVNERSVLGSRRRATCMVMVEAPDTMWPSVTSCAKARASATGSTP
jgi:hypothetical protein